MMPDFHFGLQAFEITKNSHGLSRIRTGDLRRVRATS